jgi:hypothetical protein
MGWDCRGALPLRAVPLILGTRASREISPGMVGYPSDKYVYSLALSPQKMIKLNGKRSACTEIAFYIL